MKLDRLLSIITILLNKDRVYAKELAEKFEVNVRTIYRDIDAINLSGIPIISYRGNNGGFGILDNFKIDKQFLSKSDIASILSTLKGINSGLEDKLIDRTIEKIKNLIPNKNESTDFFSDNETIGIDIIPWGVTENLKSTLKILKMSCNERKIISFKYASSSSNESTLRIVEPMTIVLKGVSWYLFAFCREKNDFRIFKIAKIKSLIVKDETFVRRNSSYRNYFKNDYINIKDVINLKLRFKKKSQKLVYEYFDEQSITLTDENSIFVDITLPNNEWIVSWLLSFGDSVEIIEPQNIKDEIIIKAKNILKNYQI
ncbi:MAG TPA: YafY family protein [Spirochaetota bacterium]|nr:YafY family protein [Spirochaetota bacterium]